MSGELDSGDGEAPRPRVSLFGRATKQAGAAAPPGPPQPPRKPRRMGISSVSGLGDFSNIQILSFLLLSAGIFLVLSIGIFKYADYLARKKGKLDMSTSY